MVWIGCVLRPAVAELTTPFPSSHKSELDEKTKMAKNKKAKAKSKRTKEPRKSSKPSAASESPVPDHHEVDHGDDDDTRDAERVSLWKKRWDESFRQYHGKACVMDWDLVREASREGAADVRSDLDRLNFVGCTKSQIDTLFPLVPGRGTAHPPCPTRISGALIREWRNASDAAQEGICHSNESKLQKLLTFLSGNRNRTDKQELGRLLMGGVETSRASLDSSPMASQEVDEDEDDEPELQQASDCESHAFVKEGSTWVWKFKHGGGSGRLSAAATAATEAETVESNRRDGADRSNIDVTAAAAAAAADDNDDNDRFGRIGDSGYRRLVELSRHLSSASQTEASRLQNDVLKIVGLRATFVHMRDKSPPSLLGSVDGLTMEAARARGNAAGAPPAGVAAGDVSGVSVATPDHHRWCSSVQDLLSNNTSTLTCRRDDMLPGYARRIQETLLAYPQVSTGGTCYRFLVPTKDVHSVLLDSGFDSRQTLHEMKIDLAALNVAFDCSSSADDEDDRTGAGAHDQHQLQAAMVAWKEVLLFLGPRSAVSGGALALWLTKNAFLLAAGDLSPLALFGEEVLGCVGFCQHFHLVATRRGINFSWAGFAREPADPEEVEMVTDKIVRLLYLDPAVDHFCLLRDRNAVLAPSSDLGTLSLVRQPRTNAAAQDPVGGVLACMYEGDRKFYCTMSTFCSCLMDVLGMGLGPPKLLVAADAEEQSAVAFPLLLGALSRSEVVEAITVLLPRGRQKGGLNRAWIDAPADALPHLDRLEEIHIV
jgi:hypothetical protein